MEKYKKDNNFPLAVFGETIPVHIRKFDEEEDASGYYYPTEKVIEVDSSLDREDFFRVLLHETMHSAFDIVSLTAAISPELEEVVVDTLSKVVVKNFNLTRKKLK